MVFSILGCGSCGGNKNPKTHTFGVYRVYKQEATLKLKCKTCGYELKFRTIRGGI